MVRKCQRRSLAYSLSFDLFPLDASVHLVQIAPVICTLRKGALEAKYEGWALSCSSTHVWFSRLWFLRLQYVYECAHALNRHCAIALARVML